MGDRLDPAYLPHCFKSVALFLCVVILLISGFYQCTSFNKNTFISNWYSDKKYHQAAFNTGIFKRQYYSATSID